MFNERGVYKNVKLVPLKEWDGVPKKMLVWSNDYNHIPKEAVVIDYKGLVNKYTGKTSKKKYWHVYNRSKSSIDFYDNAANVLTAEQEAKYEADEQLKAEKWNLQKKFRETIPDIEKYSRLKNSFSLRFSFDDVYIFGNDDGTARLEITENNKNYLVTGTLDELADWYTKYLDGVKTLREEHKNDGKIKLGLMEAYEEWRNNTLSALARKYEFEMSNVAEEQVKIETALTKKYKSDFLKPYKVK